LLDHFRGNNSWLGVPLFIVRLKCNSIIKACNKVLPNYLLNGHERLNCCA